MMAGLEYRLGRLRARLFEVVTGPPPGWWDDDEDEAPVPALAADGRRSPVEAGVTLTDGVAADLATALWRARRRLDHSQLPASSDDGRFLGRHIRAMAEALERGGVRTVEHDGERFVAGMRLDVLAFQPTPDLEADTIIETIRPAVYHEARQIQVAEVLVGTPDLAGTPDPARDPDPTGEPDPDQPIDPEQPVDHQEDQGEPLND